MLKNHFSWAFGVAVILYMACMAAQAANINYENVTIKEIVDSSAAYMGKAVEIEGEIIKECQGRGCWIIIDDGTESVLVDLKPNSFTIPLNLVGYRARVFGNVSAVGEKKMLTFEPGTPYVIGKRVEITGEFKSPLVATG